MHTLRNLLTMILLVCVLAASGCGFPDIGWPSRGDGAKQGTKTNRRNSNDPAFKRKEEFARAEERAAEQAFQRGEYDSAVKHYKAALMIFPDEWRLYNNLGRVLYVKKEYDSSLKAFKEAEKQAPDNFQIKINIGDVLAGMGRKREALNYYKKAVHLAPENSYANGALGKMHLDMRNFTSAEFRLSKAIRLDSKNGQACLGRIILYHLTGRDIRAAKEIIELERKGFKVNSELKDEVFVAAQKMKERSAR